MRKGNRTPSKTPPVIKSRLWIHRKKMGYSQQEVATLLGHTSASHVSGYERGWRIPSLQTALKLEVILCVPIAFLYPSFYRELKQGIAQAKENLRQHHHESRPISNQKT